MQCCLLIIYQRILFF